MKKVLVVLLFGMTAVASQANWAELPIPRGYQSAVASQNLSPVIFYAIALTESGQSEMTAEYRPWPWTLTIDKKPYYFRDQRAAEVALKDAVESNVAQLGVGLFQIEHRYHAHRFTSIESMLDPYANSRIAAEIFSEGLKQSEGDLWAAVGKFHSSTPAVADAYRQRVARRLFRLLGRDANDR